MDKFTELIINRSTVESLGQQEIGNLMVGFAWRENIWHKPAKILQVACLQVIGAIAIFTALMLPIDRALHSYLTPPSQQVRLTKLVCVDMTITLLILVGVNQWIYQRTKQLRRLLKLVEQIEQYNQIVSAIDTLETLANLTNAPSTQLAPTSVLEILTKTRQNLIVALQIESHSEQLHQYSNSSELTIAIAHNLIALQNLATQSQVAEYGTLLNQAWEIGMSVDRDTTIE